MRFGFVSRAGFGEKRLKLLLRPFWALFINPQRVNKIVQSIFFGVVYFINTEIFEKKNRLTS